MTFVRLKEMRTSMASGGPGGPGITSIRTEPIERSRASPWLTVTFGDSVCGGLHEPNASGGPCVRFAVLHGLNAGTSDARNGVGALWRADAARGCGGGGG